MKAAMNFQILVDVTYENHFGGACEEECKRLVVDGTYGGFQNKRLNFSYKWKKEQPNKLDSHLWSPFWISVSVFGIWKGTLILERILETLW